MDLETYMRNIRLPHTTRLYLHLRTKHLEGDVVSFRGASVISLMGTAVFSLDVPLTKTVYRHVEAKDFDQAYAIACLGVTQV